MEFSSLKLKNKAKKTEKPCRRHLRSSSNKDYSQGGNVEAHPVSKATKRDTTVREHLNSVLVTNDYAISQS
jgi:hypothetical protein